MKIISFEPNHLKQLAQHIQPQQQAGIDIFNDPDYVELLLTGESFTVVHKGVVLMCCGVFPMTNYMGRAWALLSKHAGKRLLSITKECRDFFRQSGYIRIDTPVNRGFKNGHQWCKLIGFIRETSDCGMRHYSGDDCTYDLYAFFPRDFQNVKTKPIQKT